jgi:hypothetical protein
VLRLYFVFVGRLVRVAIVALVMPIPDRILSLVETFLLSTANFCCPILTEVSVNGSLSIPM